MKPIRPTQIVIGMLCLMLRLDTVAVSELDPAIFPAQLRAQSRQICNLRAARSRMVATCMLLCLLSLLPLLFLHDLTLSVISLSAGFFFAELSIGPMWAIPMDIAPRHNGAAHAARSAL